MSQERKNYFEIWSRTATGVRLHGCAAGLTFEDACKQLACDSLDFWNHYSHRSYRGAKLYPSRADALEGG